MKIVPISILLRIFGGERRLEWINCTLVTLAVLASILRGLSERWATSENGYGVIRRSLPPVSPSHASRCTAHTEDEAGKSVFYLLAAEKNNAQSQLKHSAGWMNPVCGLWKGDTLSLHSLTVVEKKKDFPPNSSVCTSQHKLRLTTKNSFLYASKNYTSKQLKKNIKMH